MSMEFTAFHDLNEDALDYHGLYRAILDTTGSPSMIVNGDGMVLMANDFFARIIGYSREEIEGLMYLPEFIHPSCREQVHTYHHLRRKDPGEVPDSYETILIDRNGSPRHLLICVSMIPGTDISIITGLDFTRQRETMEALGESEERYRSLVRLLPEAVIVHSDGCIRYLNDSAVKLLGVADTDGALGKQIDEFIRDRSGDLPGCSAGSHIERMGITERSVIRNDRRSFEVEIRSVSISYQGERAILWIIRDITSQKLAELEIKRQNNHLSIINEIVRVANSSLSFDEMLEFILKRTLELLNFDAGWIYIKKPNGRKAELISAIGVPKSFRVNAAEIVIRDWPYNLIFFAGQSRFVNNLPEHPPGPADTRILEEVDAISLAGIPLISESVVVGALFIASRMQYRFNEEDVTILETIGTKIGGIILRGMLQDQLQLVFEETVFYLDLLMHDIRRATVDSLNSIRALREGNSTESDLDRIEANQKQCIEIIDNIKVVQKLSRGQATLIPVDLDDAIRTEAEKFPEMSIYYERTGLNVLADEYFPDILANLLGNCWKFGRPHVAVRISTALTGSSVLISVEDTGPGMSDERKSQCFSSFETPMRTLGGKGLGFQICRMLIERYGGRIWAEDRIPGRPSFGLAVRFTVPLDRSE